MVSQSHFPTILAYILYMLALIVLVSYCAGLVISLYLNAEFGVSRIGEAGRWLAILCDIFKIALSAAILFISGTLYRLLCLSAILAFACLSILSSYGYTIQKLETNTGKARAEKQRYQALKRQREKLHLQLKQLGPYKSPKSIEKELQILKQNRIYKDTKRSNKCQNATIPESETLCSQIGNLEIALIQAREWKKHSKQLNTELSQVKAELKRVNLTAINTREDRFAQSFGEADQVNMVLTLFLALLVEITTTAGFAVILVLYQAAGDILKARHQIDAHELPVTSKERQVVMTRAFLECCTLKDKSAFTLSVDLYAAFQTWCEENEYPVMTQKKLGEALTALGYSRCRAPSHISRKRLTGYSGFSIRMAGQDCGDDRGYHGEGYPSQS